MQNVLNVDFLNQICTIIHVSNFFLFGSHSNMFECVVFIAF